MTMVETNRTSLEEYLENIKPGEDVLLEYTSREPAHVLFHCLMKCLKERGYSTVIVDELDQLHVFKVQLKLAGADTSPIDSARVIKVGGTLQTGNVIGRVDLSKEIPIRKKYYEEILEKIGEDYTVRIVLGFDKILAMHEESRKELETLFSYMIRPHLGDERRTTVYFINTDLVSERTLMEFREHASRVFRARMLAGDLLLEVVKSPIPSEYGNEIKVRLEDL
ncbi:hypothetical protein A3L11_09345 [Thermococcus siculi]|uniref:KaiC-like domain-containing protein n=1 Tax=Thermococcus siculi TaxID=72803 RepID=A0A2Z2MM16_9EURY|nr:DUF257 family protein [Thermococcus siculi]ASJ09422.1 hypothetical protein A3L11_09345 [Thermococcus siculi]